MPSATDIQPATVSPPKSPAPRRLLSLDALRGFDMFWIIGADSLIYALNRMSSNPVTNSLNYQLNHADWDGFRFYDLIFPLFVFLVGVSTVFSLTRIIEQHGRTAAVKRIAIRSALLFLIGIFYSGGISNAWPDIRLMGVLNRIAIAYFFTGLLFCFLKPRALAGVCAAILVGYWALLAFTPIRDIQLTRGALAAVAEERGEPELAAALRERRGGNPSARKDSPVWEIAERLFYSTTNYVAGRDAVRTNAVVATPESGSATNYVVARFNPGLNVTDHIDFKYLGGRKYDQFFDPEGLLSNLPAIATCLLGLFAGLLLRAANFCDKWKLIYLASFGAGAVLLGWLWGIEFPVIKKIWTSSYVLVAAGYSALLLAAFYLIVDVWKYQKWCQPFVWIGMNAITIYLVSSFVSWSGLSRRLLGGDVRNFLDAKVAAGFGELMITIGGLVLAFLFVRFLYKRQIFLRL